MRNRLILCGFLLLSAISAFAQNPPAALMPVVRQQFFSPAGVPLPGCQIFTYAAGTTTPQATYTDFTLTIQNSNPVICDSGGFATIWLSGLSYKIVVQDQNGVQQYSVDNVSDPGQLLYLKAILLNPVARANQTVNGPITADFFTGATAHVTSPGVRVAILDPTSVLDTPLNPPLLQTTTPAAGGQTYTIGDPLSNANFVLSPQGTHGVGNFLDCTLAGITCFRTATAYFQGASCNGVNASLGWDTFSTNAPAALCITGTNMQKGVMALPGAATVVQEATGTAAGAGTVTLTYPNATVTGNALVAVIAFDGTHTISGCTDGTNTYAQAKHVANGALSVDVWDIGNATTKTAGTTLTCTFSAASNGAMHFMEVQDLTASPLDVTGSNTGSGTTVNCQASGGTTQNTEWALCFGGTLTAPTVAGGAGAVLHGNIAQSTNVKAFDQGTILQVTGIPGNIFTLGTSSTWAGGMVTFKVNVQAIAQAQRTIVLPSAYNQLQPVNAAIKWQNPAAANTPGSMSVVLGAALNCPTDGSTDDPVFLAATTTTTNVSASGPGIITTSQLASLGNTGCASNSLMHIQISRQRYNMNDIYDKFVYVYGMGLSLGINQ